ncbi:MAG: DEAD/DEAH box helicase [Moraxellaceae bacterium]
MIEEIINSNDIKPIISAIIKDIHRNGPSNPITMEKLAYIKRHKRDLLLPYEAKIVNLMGLFYKATNPNSILEEMYSIYMKSIEDETGIILTPSQASALKEIKNHTHFSFSAPTSAGKSHLFRQIIKSSEKDIIIVVPSRALIAEYFHEITKITDKDVLVLQFIENINTEKTKRRIFIITPERGVELFRKAKELNIELFLLDEAQISEEPIRGMKFDSFVRRINGAMPQAKKIFAHPFIENPEAQLKKHRTIENSSSKKYTQQAVGKIFISQKAGKFTYFSPNIECNDLPINQDIVEEILKNNGTLLLYISKTKIYSGNYKNEFEKYLALCPRINNSRAGALTEKLRVFIGASIGYGSKYSTLIDLMDKGIVIHHGSMPLKARLIIEDFIKEGHARICFATSTLSQGINMPFDAVWIDNFRDMKPLTLKNLIGRSGRSTPEKDSVDYGFTIINEINKQTFKSRIRETITISETSSLDDPSTDPEADTADVIEAIRQNTFNDDLFLPDSQVDRIEKSNIDTSIKYILDTLLKDGRPLTGGEYYKLSDHFRKKIKNSFKEIYLSHLRRKNLERAEISILSAAIPIMLWHIQGKSFSEIVSLRHAFLSERDKQALLTREGKSSGLSNKLIERQIEKLKIRYTPTPSSLPNKNASSAPLYPETTSVTAIQYDTIVYDTYDYLDKVISLSLADPICAAFIIFHNKTGDTRAINMANYIRFGTNDDTEIWLLRYGFSFEDIEWIKNHIAKIDSRKIIFKESISTLNEERAKVIERYI